jgi:phosphoribosylformylglycinamidine synthase subunit PurS
MKIQILVRLKSGVLDVQGKAVEHGLGDAALSNVRIGKLIELEIDAPNADAAKEKVTELCQKVLVNPVMETFEIKVP